MQENSSKTVKPIDKPQHISLLMLNRARPYYLDKSLDSVDRTIGDPSSIDAWIYVDNDDDITKRYISSGSYFRFSFKINWVVGERTASMGQMINILREKCTTNPGIYQLWPDDYVLKSRNWDGRIRDVFNRYPDGIVMAYFPDPVVGSSDQATILTLSAQWTNITGKVLTEFFPYWKEDTWLDHVSQLVQRKVRLDDISIEPIGGKGKTQRLKNLPFWDRFFNNLMDERIKEANLLRQAIYPKDSPEYQKSLEEAERLAKTLAEKREKTTIDSLLAMERAYSSFPEKPQPHLIALYLVLEARAVSHLCGKVDSLMQAGDFGKALKMLDNVILAEQEYKNINYLRAVCLKHLGRPNEVAQAARKELSLQPEHKASIEIIERQPPYLPEEALLRGQSQRLNDAVESATSQNITWEQVKRMHVIRLYAGDVPAQKEYDQVVGLSLTRNDHNHIRHDITKPFPLADNTVDSFQAEDVFEHIQYEKLLPVINEIFRILKPGGLFRLSLPDYGCDVLQNRCVKNEKGCILFDPGGGGTPDNPGHVWFPRTDALRHLLEKTKFHKSATIEFLHYYNMDGTFVTKPIDYKKGHIMRTPDFDKRVKSPHRPMSLVVDLTKGKEALSETKSVLCTPQIQKNGAPKFSFIMIVLNGMPFIEYSLKSVYDFAHEIIIVEGAVENCMFAANPDGSSTDGTVEFIKSFPDRQNKIKLVQGKWPEKCEMQNEALKHVTGNYVWLIDSDEVYKREDLEKIRQILQKDHSITQVNFIPDSFWKGLDYIIVSSKFSEDQFHHRRLFKYVPGAIFTSNRPPTMVWPGSDKTTEQMHLLDGTTTRQMGIIFYHYSCVLDKQVRQKIELYNRYNWGDKCGINMFEWYKECFLKWTPLNREQIDAKYPIWTGDTNSHTLPFIGTHPDVMMEYVRGSWTNAGRNDHGSIMQHVTDTVHEVKSRFPQEQILAIETGTIRSYDERHNSTYHISRALGDRGSLISVDISTDSIRRSKNICYDTTNVEWVHSDSMQYLRRQKDIKFHFVFLDSVNDKDLIFEEFRLVVPMMVEDGILMVDDAGITEDGRGIDASVAAQKGHRLWDFLKSCGIQPLVLKTVPGRGTQLKIVMSRENLLRISNSLGRFGTQTEDSADGLAHIEHVLTEEHRPDAQRPSADTAACSSESIQANALNQQGEALSDIGDIEGAINAFTRAIEIQSDFAVPYNNLGVLFWQKGQIENAVKHFVKALEIDPNNRDTIWNCAEVFKSLQRFEDARQIYSSYLKRNPDDKEIASALLQLQPEHKVPQEICRQTEEIRPDAQRPSADTAAYPSKSAQAKALNQQGEYLFVKGDIEGALNAFASAIEIHSDFALPHNNLGVLFWKKGQTENAVKHFVKALEIDPNDRDTILNCAEAFKSLQRFEDARQIYSSYLKTNLDDKEIAKALFQLQNSTELTNRDNRSEKITNPIHFFTIVLNGQPFIRHHIEVFKKLPFRWHWHIIEGVAEFAHDTAVWAKNNGSISEQLHRKGLSKDGTTEYIDELAKQYPENVTVYRKSPGVFWAGKVEMVNAPLANINESCLLWQIDVDELWTSEQICAAREMFIAEPNRTAAYYLNHFFVGENLVTITIDTYGNNTGYEWLRTWRFKPGFQWATHAPPRLCMPVQDGKWVDIATITPFKHYETAAKNLVFQHYAYVTKEQLAFKEIYYGYKNATEQWLRLQRHNDFPVFLRDYFAWVKDGAQVNTVQSQNITPLAWKDTNGQWQFSSSHLSSEPQPTLPSKNYKHILWIRPDSIGDNVLAASMLPHIRKKYKNAKITIVCQEHIAKLYEACPYADNIIALNKGRFLQNEQYYEEIRNSLRTLKADLSLHSVYSRELAGDLLVIDCSKAEERVALEGDTHNILANQKSKLDKLYTRLLPSKGKHKLELNRHRDFLRGLNIDVPSLKPMIWTTVEDEEFAENFFEENSFRPEHTIALFAGAQQRQRLYDKYGESLSEFCKKNHLSVIALGAENDRDINQRNLDPIGVKTVNLSGKTTIRQVAAIMKRSRLTVGAETGLAHISCAVGTPNVILLGGGHFGRFMPYSPLTSIVCLPLKCYGCNWGCRYQDSHCIKGIKPEVVAEALRQTFANPSEKTRVFAQGESLWEPNPWQPAWCSFEEHLDIDTVKIILVPPEPSRRSDGLAHIAHLLSEELRPDAQHLSADTAVLSSKSTQVTTNPLGET